MKTSASFISRILRVRRQGFSLVEVAIALGIAGIALFSVVGLMPPLLDSERSSSIRSALPQLTTQIMGELRSGKYPATLPSTVTYYLSGGCHLTTPAAQGLDAPVYRCTVTFSAINPSSADPAAGGIPRVGTQTCTVKLAFIYQSQPTASPLVIHATLANR